MPPTVSLIIRTRASRPALLNRAIRSALAQDTPPTEIIVVEDGGTTLADTLPAGIAYLPVARAGRSAAGNAGLAAAKGELAGFLDDDDWLLPHHLSTLTRALGDAPAAYALAEEVSSDRRRITGVTPFSRARLWAGNFLAIQSVLFRRSLYLEKGGLDQNLEALEDWDLWLRYSRDAAFTGVPEVTSGYSMPSGRVLKQRERDHAPALKQVLAKHAGLISTFSLAEITAIEADFRSRMDDMAGARWCLGRLWRRIRDGR